MIEKRMKGKTDEDEHNIAYNNSNLNHKEFSPLVWMLWSLVILKSAINNGDCACLYYMSTTGMCCPFSLLLICWWLSFTWGLSEIAIKRKDNINKYWEICGIMKRNASLIFHKRQMQLTLTKSYMIYHISKFYMISKYFISHMKGWSFWKLQCLKVNKSG